MDTSQIKKIQAMKRHKRLLFLDNLYFYSFTTFTCIIFCCVPIFLPYLSSLATHIFFVWIPSSVSAFCSSKLFFILGNLIIVFLIVNSRVFSSKASTSSSTSASNISDVYYDEYMMKSRVSQKTKVSSFEVIEGRKLMEEHVLEYVNMKEEEEEEDGEESLGYCEDYDELNKRADAFIARVNKHMKLELSLLECGTYS